jgi:hypothetical protein
VNGSLITLFWPASMSNYTLQANSSLQSTGWINVSSLTVGDEKRATILPVTSTQFYRLKRL